MQILLLSVSLKCIPEMLLLVFYLPGCETQDLQRPENKIKTLQNIYVINSIKSRGFCGNVAFNIHSVEGVVFKLNNDGVI